MSTDPVVHDALTRAVPLRTELAPDWRAVVSRAEGKRPRRSRPLLVAAVVAAALALVGVAIADGFGFPGFAATEHPATGADVPDAQTLAEIQSACSGGAAPLPASFYNPYCHLDLSSSRFLTDDGPGGKVWIIADSRGELCTVGVLWECLAPPTKSRPITFAASNESPTDGGDFFAGGLAMDGVTSVSFAPVPGDGTTVTVPVKDNIWVYRASNSHADGGDCIVAHFSDGSTADPFPEVPCP